MAEMGKDLDKTANRDNLRYEYWGRQKDENEIVKKKEEWQRRKEAEGIKDCRIVDGALEVQVQYASLIKWKNINTLQRYKRERLVNFFNVQQGEPRRLFDEFLNNLKDKIVIKAPKTSRKLGKKHSKKATEEEGDTEIEEEMDSTGTSTNETPSIPQRSTLTDIPSNRCTPSPSITTNINVDDFEGLGDGERENSGERREEGGMEENKHRRMGIQTTTSPLVKSPIPRIVIRRFPKLTTGIFGSRVNNKGKLELQLDNRSGTRYWKLLDYCGEFQLNYIIAHFDAFDQTEPRKRLFQELLRSGRFEGTHNRELNIYYEQSASNSSVIGEIGNDELEGETQLPTVIGKSMAITKDKNSTASSLSTAATLDCRKTGAFEQGTVLPHLFDSVMGVRRQYLRSQSLLCKIVSTSCLKYEWKFLTQCENYNRQPFLDFFERCPKLVCEKGLYVWWHNLTAQKLKIRCEMGQMSRPQFQFFSSLGALQILKIVNNKIVNPASVKSVVDQYRPRKTMSGVGAIAVTPECPSMASGFHYRPSLPFYHEIDGHTTYNRTSEC